MKLRKITTVWGVFPVILAEVPGNGWASAFSFMAFSIPALFLVPTLNAMGPEWLLALLVLGISVVRIPADKWDRPDMIPHELFHVKQWVLTFGLAGILNRIPAVRLRLEAAAYAESVRAGRDIEICAVALSDLHYGTGISHEDARAMITKYTVSKRLF